MKKRILMLLLALTVLLGAFTLTASAAEIIDSGTCGENLTWTLNSGGTLTISGSGAMKNYSWEEAPWYSLQEDIVSVVVEFGVTNIGGGAFKFCDSLSSIALPDSVTSIGDEAFYRCICLGSITIPEGVTSIGGLTFSRCESLTGIWVEDGNTNYSSDDYGVLFNKNKTQLIQVPGAIAGTYSVPDSVTSIGGAAFYECTSLSNITLPDSITSIGDSAFCYCTSLSSITIPEGVTNIGALTFSGCESLTGIWVEDGNPNYSSDDHGVLFNKSKTQLIQAPGAIAGAYSVADSVTSIGDHAFSYCESLSSITLPEGVTSIGDWAFAFCENLSSITIPDSVTGIGDFAFYYCVNLGTVHYAGTEAQRADISIDEYNAYLTDATWHYECNGIDCQETETTPTEPEETQPEESKPVENPFGDVAEDAYYAKPVLWAVSKGVTNGLSADIFGPDATCTRAQIVTFLWRSKGCPAPASADNPFTDVPADAWYTDAVLWAVGEGITTGTSATTFSPDAGCTRGQVATFLWRAENQPAPGGNNIFSDIAPGAYYYDAVLWAVEKGITNGMGNGTFAPDATCTRGQIVTFLYRALV